MRHKYFYAYEITDPTVRIPGSERFMSLRVAREYAQTKERAWVGTMDGQIDERWYKGKRTSYRNRKGDIVAMSYRAKTVTEMVDNIENGAQIGDYREVSITTATERSAVSLLLNGTAHRWELAGFYGRTVLLRRIKGVGD